MAEIEVSILCTEHCANTPAAIETVERVAAELNVPIQLKKIVIRTQEEAELHRFLGSPTIRVNGQDIEPAARNARGFGLT